PITTKHQQTTSDGLVILDPQPEPCTPNDPLNWPRWRRDSALAALSLFALVGGGMTPVLAAGFPEVASTFHTSVPRTALTTGMFMLGLGTGCAFTSGPAAALFGKRPVYLGGAALFCVASAWCAASRSFASLLAARVVQGVCISPVEALAAATIADLFFLHERAFRIGVYALAMLGGKNLVPLASAAVLERRGWRWVFWIVVIVGALCGVVMFLFLPETFWDREEPPRNLQTVLVEAAAPAPEVVVSQCIGEADEGKDESRTDEKDESRTDETESDQAKASTLETATPAEQSSSAQLASTVSVEDSLAVSTPCLAAGSPLILNVHDPERAATCPPPSQNIYTNRLRHAPQPESFASQLRPWHGRLRPLESWRRVAVRPLVLLTYPAVLWSAAVYACSIGWLVVLSETVGVVYRQRSSYGFGAFDVGLVYMAPFVGGVLGTAVAGRASDALVRAMARRNAGVYEPEFRLVMALPVAVATAAGLMGFGWSAEAGDAWEVPTVFFGLVSFGCALGSTTAITFCVDSYRQFAGEALVTLNFSKDIFHGLVFSMFVTEWVERDGPKTVFLWIGAIQLVLLTTTVPMFLFGKRARQWTEKRKICASIMCSR
ncbi:major facilitator superfamily domain-containing protein, partial [Lasiosphaeria miniovina]